MRRIQPQLIDLRGEKPRPWFLALLWELGLWPGRAGFDARGEPLLTGAQYLDLMGGTVFQPLPPGGPMNDIPTAQERLARTTATQDARLADERRQVAALIDGATGHAVDAPSKLSPELTAWLRGQGYQLQTVQRGVNEFVTEIRWGPEGPQQLKEG